MFIGHKHTGAAQQCETAKARMETAPTEQRTATCTIVKKQKKNRKLLRAKTAWKKTEPKKKCKIKINVRSK